VACILVYNGIDGVWKPGVYQIHKQFLCKSSTFMIIQQFDQKALLRPSRVPHELSVTVLFEVNFWPQRKKWRLFVQALLIVKSLQFDLHDICTGCLYDPFCLILFLHNSSAIQVDSLAMVTGELEGRSLKEP
jgi:hypothetical protein